MSRNSGLSLPLLALVAIALTALPSCSRKANADTKPKTDTPAGAVSIPTAPAIAPDGAIPHVVRRGETVASVLHSFSPAMTYETAPEMDAAFRKANSDLKGNALTPGSIVYVPGVTHVFDEHPDQVPSDFEVRAIYLTGVMAASEHGARIIREWKSVGGNAVVFDVKDSDGIINIPFVHPVNSSAQHPYIRNLSKLVHFLHEQNMHAIARIAIFRDEQLVTRHPELAVHSRATGQPWRENGKLVWTDPSNLEVQRYDIALAKAAAALGVDEVQFDYVRFPAEGDQKDAKFQYESAHPDWHRTDVITHFLEDAHRDLRPTGVLLSLDVFGVMAWQRPVDLAHTGQDIPNMARNCDVMSPMIYPSHFFGMDGYADPGDAPEHFISESMERFRKVTAGTGVVLRPWLQAFGWRTKTYSPEYIVTQVGVARGNGGVGFLFWNARNDYSKPFAAMPVMRRDPKKFFQVYGSSVASASAPQPVAPGGGK